VIIPALHRPDLTARCLSFLARQSLSRDTYEIVIVENEALPDLIVKDQLGPNVRTILLERNYGTTASINLGITDTSSKYVLLLNNDVELETQFIAKLVAAVEADSNRAFATGKLLSVAQKNHLDGAGDALLLGGGAYRLGHGDMDTGQFEKACWILAGCGAGTLFRRSVLNEIQGLDEDFFAYLDDVDLAVRAQLMGYTGYYVPDALGYHMGSATLGSSMHPKIVELITRNQLCLIAKCYPAAVVWKLLPRILVFQMLWLATTMRRKRLLAYCQGLLGATKLMPRILHKRAKVLKQKRITDREFVKILCVSERQVFDWHNTRPPGRRSQLLNMYFRLFGPPPHPNCGLQGEE
jgi:GT2 family glycosyltransferase